MNDIKIITDPDGGDGLPVAEATVHNGIVYVSGFVGYDRRTLKVVGPDLESQTKQTLKLIDEVLGWAGTTRSRIVRMRVYLRHVERDFKPFNKIFREWIGDHMPARTTVGAELADPSLLIEIDAQAVVGSEIAEKAGSSTLVQDHG
jgi:enamine deaminase RidA (YjgF/YER057c/UK114 family)